MLSILRKCKKHAKTLLKRVKSTCANLTVHGPSFLVRKDIHWSFRLIYFIIYVHIWFAFLYTIRRYYNHYTENTIRFTTRTDYLHWNTTFPSITVCESPNFDTIMKQSERLDSGADSKVERFIAEAAFFTGTCHSCNSICEYESFCTLDLLTLSTMYRTICDNFFHYCFWNGKLIECCKHFQPLQTEYGLCYSLNNKIANSESQIFVKTGNGEQMDTLEIIMNRDSETFLHSPEDVPFWNMEYDRRISVAYGTKAFIVFSIMDIINEPEVSIITPEVRKCRFINEVPEDFLAFKVYSYSVCITQCRIEMQIRLCNCTHHLSPPEYADRFCDLDGLQCLTKHFETLRKLKVPETNDTGLECDCLPSCTEPDYNIISKKLEEPVQDVHLSSVKITLANRPYQRLTRQVARTTLDLVVAMGNCFGLCFGGSLLSIAEIIYYLCFKKWEYGREKA